ncbi:MAG: sulfur transferase domain-containing protein [Pseudomonadaceae bacterium]|nr:sulfur transferase domain-containing protein [Pseudomonadaceae bacterium]
MSKTAVIVLLWMCFASAATFAQSPGFLQTPVAMDADGFQEALFKVAPNVYLSGQPSEAGFARARELGVTRVINLRTSMEMDSREVVPFDEAQLLADLGLDYVHVPSGGPKTPYAPELVAQVADAIADTQGNVLLHCTVAWRATHLWTAYLIEHQNVPFAQALAVGRQLNFGTFPLEGFLDAPLTVTPLQTPQRKDVDE